MSGFSRKAQAESEIDAIVRNVCDAFCDEFGVEPSVSNDGAPFSFRVYHFDPRGKCVVIARRVIDYWVLDVVIQAPRKDEILKGQASTTDTSYDGVKAAISTAIYHGVVVDRVGARLSVVLGASAQPNRSSEEVTNPSTCRRYAPYHVFFPPQGWKTIMPSPS